MLSRLYIPHKMCNKAEEGSEKQKKLKVCLVSGKFKFDALMEMITEDSVLSERIYTKVTQAEVAPLIINFFPRKVFTDMLKRTSSKDYLEKLDEFVLKEENEA